MSARPGSATGMSSSARAAGIPALVRRWPSGWKPPGSSRRPVPRSRACPGRSGDGAFGAVARAGQLGRTLHRPGAGLRQAASRRQLRDGRRPAGSGADRGPGGERRAEGGRRAHGPGSRRRRCHRRHARPAGRASRRHGHRYGGPAQRRASRHHHRGPARGRTGPHDDRGPGRAGRSAARRAGPAGRPGRAEHRLHQVVFAGAGG